MKYEVRFFDTVSNLMEVYCIVPSLELAKEKAIELNVRLGKGFVQVWNGKIIEFEINDSGESYHG